VGKFRKVLLIGISFKLLLAFSSLSCFSQIITTRAPDSIGMTDNYNFYIFWLNNEGRRSLAMAFANDTISICPYIVHTQDNSLFIAVTIQELAHYFNYVSHGEVIKTDTLQQEAQTKHLINSDYWKMSPDLKKIVYQGDDGSSIKKAIIIKKATTLKEGIAAEYAYLAKELGRRGIDWKPLGQYLHPFSSKHYDIIKVKIINTNKIRYFCFDITKFFGKF
jgi:hypothetical protein